MKILYVCHRFPFPPTRGGKIRPFNMIRHFAQSHEVTVVSMVRSEEEAREGEGLREFCAHYEMVRVHDLPQWGRTLLRLPTPVPSSFGYFYSHDMGRRIHALAQRERFDLLFVHCSSVARYVEGIPAPKILDFGDMDSQKWKEYALVRSAPVSWGYALEAAKLEREEARLARAFDMCTATTRAEWETLQGYRTGTPSDWFPNGVDGASFAPSTEPYDPDSVVFLGRMDYYPNQVAMIEFCRDVLPALRARRPATRLAIVGANPSPAIAKLGELAGVTVTGTVPAVQPYLQRAAVMVAPLTIARGTQNKILEGMAAGVPVVASRLAAGGVDAVAPDHLLAATTPAEYVDALTRVLDNPGERERLARAGRARVLTHHDWAHSMRRLDGIVERCLAARPAARVSRSPRNRKARAA